MSDETKEKIDDGGPAFPCPEKRMTAVAPDGSTQSVDLGSQPGMSTRTWLAGMSIIGRRANRGYPPGSKQLAASALEDADAAIAQLRKDADQ